eukprot:403073-Prorocentrum_minimum.AAC.5
MIRKGRRTFGPSNDFKYNRRTDASPIPSPEVACVCLEFLMIGWAAALAFHATSLREDPKIVVITKP